MTEVDMLEASSYDDWDCSACVEVLERVEREPVNTISEEICSKVSKICCDQPLLDNIFF